MSIQGDSFKVSFKWLHYIKVSFILFKTSYKMLSHCALSFLTRIKNILVNCLLLDTEVYVKRQFTNHFLLFLFILELGDIFASIGVRELQSNSSEAFATFADCHRFFHTLLHLF